MSIPPKKRHPGSVFHDSGNWVAGPMDQATPAQSDRGDGVQDKANPKQGHPVVAAQRKHEP